MEQRMTCSCAERWSFLFPHSGGNGCPVTQEDIQEKDVQNYITGLFHEIERLNKESRNDPGYGVTNEWNERFALISELEVLWVDLRYYVLS